ncbi:MAG: molybdenum cofactor biosynthesis protein A [Candidatus Omnitrophota bacterium]|jgi:molybdenum cofactor biosynthesis protein A
MRDLKPLVDSYGRTIDYLRISLTDICNFSCVYCDPPQGTAALPINQYLSLDELERFVRASVHMGINRIRLTGGEPTLRKDLITIVTRLKSIPGIEDLSLTTNGQRLTPLLEPLKTAGLDRINISMDSLDPRRFEAVTQSKAMHAVYESVFEALKHGFGVKVNVVAMQGLLREEILKFVALARDYSLEIRFLEFMPLCGESWQADLFLPIAGIRAIIQESFELLPLSREGQVAESYGLKDGLGRVGFIASMTESFCNTCSRFRISASGDIYPCLFSETKVSVFKILKNKLSDAELIQAIRLAAAIKPRGNNYIDKPYSKDNQDTQALIKNPLIKTIGG